MRYKDMDVYKRIQIALNEYVDMPRSSLILDGREGLPLLEDALTVASRILDTSLERLQYHPDYLYIESEKTLGVEESTEIIAKAKLVPSLSNHTVVVINHFETMTPQAQNKLLKLIEDNAQILVLGIVYGEGILPTIRSRMRCISYTPVPKETFISTLCSEGISEENASVIYYLSDGCPDLIESQDALISIYMEIQNAIRSDYRKLFEILHLVKEKDTQSFYSLYPNKIRSLYRFIGTCIMNCSFGYSSCMSEKDLDRLAILNKHLTICEKGFYNQNHLFLAIAELQ